MPCRKEIPRKAGGKELQSRAYWRMIEVGAVARSFVPLWKCIGVTYYRVSHCFYDDRGTKKESAVTMSCDPPHCVVVVNINVLPASAHLL